MPATTPTAIIGWASPDFQDSSWPILRFNAGWGEQGYKRYAGFGWYRFKVVCQTMTLNLLERVSRRQGVQDALKRIGRRR
jgi:hypothetical protein